MSQIFQKTKPSFLEAGLPCAALSAECQRDNNARQRPPQNRLHIWWARRSPTICRAAILAALLPHDLNLDEAIASTHSRRAVCRGPGGATAQAPTSPGILRAVAY
ncbi:MAG: DUF1156 domain-containing protein [Candidatus Binatia bacterium]